MNATLACTNYQSVRATLNPQAMEFEVFTQITNRLEYYYNQALSSAQKYLCVGLAEALYDNRQLWNVIAADVMNVANPYPLELKAQLVSLSQFVRKQTGIVLQDISGMQILIDINRSIIAGLQRQYINEGDENGRS